MRFRVRVRVRVKVGATVGLAPKRSENLHLKNSIY